MTEQLDARARQILLAIIQEFIRTPEPVGSRTITRHTDVGVSPATVRNVMSDLEEAGLLAQPHTSAGRIPTAKAFRMYIQELLAVRRLTPRQQAEVVEGLHPTPDVPTMLEEASRVLSQLSRQAGVVLGPRFTETIFRRIQFVRLSERQVLCVFVAANGFVQHRLVEADDPVADADVERFTNYVHEQLAGLTLREMRERIVTAMGEERSLYDTLLSRALELARKATAETGAEEGGEHVYIDGQRNLLDQPEFADLDRMKQLFRAFEEKRQLVRMLDEAARAPGVGVVALDQAGLPGVRVIIGAETRNRDLAGCGIIAATYGPSEPGGAAGSGGGLGTIAVVGPTRMDYARLIPLVQFTAERLSLLIPDPE